MKLSEIYRIYKEVTTMEKEHLIEMRQQLGIPSAEELHRVAKERSDQRENELEEAALLVLREPIRSFILNQKEVLDKGKEYDLSLKDVATYCAAASRSVCSPTSPEEFDAVVNSVIMELMMLGYKTDLNKRQDDLAVIYISAP